MVLVLSACGATSVERISSPVPETLPATTTTTTTVVVGTTVPTTVPAVSTTTTIHLTGDCVEWADDALAIGWPLGELPTVQYLMYRESRCDPSQYNPDDPRGGSHGLLQINGHWCRPNPTYGIDIGWLQENGMLQSCDDLYDPWVNLQSALLIWTEYGFEPWGL